MGCATGIVKYIVFLANLVFALAGLALVIIGCLYKFNYSDITKALPSDFGLAPILFIIIGAIVFITAFFGCCGAVRESTCMLTTYAIILLTIFIIQVAIGVYAFIQIKDTYALQKSITQNYRKTFDERHHIREANETVQATQSWLHCCGVDGPDDWNHIPPTCCSNNNVHCSRASPDLYQNGCATQIFDLLQKSTKVIGGVAIGIAAVEILGAVFGLCLSSSIRNHYRRNIYA
ncbi:CD151 antigen-like [Aethina tumida]|uniref:CD151 antigen-like n=1 Tax=Aethina tumida TaxID=116153 RepID=UPI0021498B14|nr:CD151 antigen-like [Aethina tumida]